MLRAGASKRNRCSTLRRFNTTRYRVIRRRRRPHTNVFQHQATTTNRGQCDQRHQAITMSQWRCALQPATMTNRLLYALIHRTSTTNQAFSVNQCHLIDDFCACCYRRRRVRRIRSLGQCSSKRIRSGSFYSIECVLRCNW